MSIAGREPVKLIAMFRLATKGDAAERAREAFTGMSREEVTEIVATALEVVVRESPGDVTAAARTTFAFLGLELDKLWVGPP